jgi:hypothetical protein
MTLTPFCGPSYNAVVRKQSYLMACHEDEHESRDIAPPVKPPLQYDINSKDNVFNSSKSLNSFYQGNYFDTNE